MKPGDILKEFIEKVTVIVPDCYIIVIMLKLPTHSQIQNWLCYLSQTRNMLYRCVSTLILWNDEWFDGFVDDQPKIAPWEEEDGIYGIMVRTNYYNITFEE